MAGFSVSVHINHAALDGVIARLPAGQEAISDLGADAVVEGAKARAAVDTGYMRDHIEKRAFGSERVVISEAPYSGFVEYGTRNMAAQPFMRPALEAVKWGDILREFFRRIGL